MVTGSDKEAGVKWGIRICIGLAILFVTLGFVAAFVGYRTPRPDDNFLNDLGNFGSYLQGTTASFWSLAGLLIIFVAFLAQKQQLQRQETELEEQKQQFKIQNESIKRQNFESSFFQLLNQHRQILTEMHYRHPFLPSQEGMECFRVWYDQQLRSYYAGQISRGEITDEKQLAIRAYEAFYQGRQHELGHYFRNLYHLVKFVNESDALKAENADADYKNRRRYTSLARAQLSVYELCLLFYNGLCSEGEKFKPLIEKFGFLENLHDRGKILLNPIHENYYDKKAFE